MFFWHKNPAKVVPFRSRAERELEQDVDEAEEQYDAAVEYMERRVTASLMSLGFSRQYAEVVAEHLASDYAIGDHEDHPLWDKKIRAFDQGYSTMDFAPRTRRRLEDIE